MAGSTISVGMNIGDVKTAGVELIKLLGEQVDATLKLAEAQVKYNKEGEQVAKVLKGITDAGDRYTVTVKEVGNAYELVNAQINKAKTSMAGMLAAQREAAAASKAEARALDEKAASQKKMLDLMAQGSNANLAKQVFIGGMSQAGREAAAAKEYRAPTNDFVGPPAPPKGFIGSLFGGDDMDKAQKKSERLFITWQGIVRLIQAQLIKKAISDIGSAMASSVEDASKFSKAMAEIRTISQDAPQSVEKWRSEIIKLSNAFGQSPTDVANAAYETLSNQIAKGPEVVDFLTTAMKFGAATVSTTTDSVNLLSSALKSFNLPTSDAERVASIFFKTIDLGRVRAKDLADTFGRVGSIANQAGIKLEEVAAAIATITIRGVKPADSMTILSNVIQKLISPTAEMKKLFAEWGVESGQAAIAAFGFQGVLARLNEESQKGTEGFAQLFNNVRGLRGAFQLSGQGFSDYQQNLQKITQGQKEYNAASKEYLESPGKQLDIATQKIKNLFQEDFGKNAVQTLVDFNKWFETSSGSADGLERTVKLLVKTLTIGLSVMIAWRTATLANATAGLSWSVVLQKLAVDAKVLSANLASAAAIYAVPFAIGYATGEVLQAARDPGKTRGQIEAEVAEEAQRKRDADKKRLEREGDPDREDVQKIKSAMDTRYQFLLQYSTNSVKLSNDLKQRTIDNYKDITDAVKISSKTYFDSILAKMSELRKASSEAEQLIKQSLKHSEDYPRKAQNTLFNERMKYANEGYLAYTNGSPEIVNNQKIPLLEKQIAEVLKQAREKAGQGTKEAFDESRKLYDDVQKLMAQLFDARTATEKRIYDERVARGQESPTRLVFNPFTGEMTKQFEFVAKTSVLEKELLTLGKERLANEQRFRDLQKERAAQAQAEVASERERLRGLQQAFTAIEKISVFSDKGVLKEEYKKDPALATRQFDEQAAKIRSLAGNEGFGTQYQVFQDLQKQRVALVQQTEQAIRAEQAQSAQQAIIKAKEGSQKLIDGAAVASDEAKKKISKGLEVLDRDLAGIEQRTLRRQSTKLDLGPLGEIDDHGLLRNGMKTINSEESRKIALDALKSVREARVAFEKDQTPEKLDILKKKLQELKSAAKDYIQEFTGKSADVQADVGDKVTQGDRIRGLDIGVSLAGQGVNDQASAQGQLAQARTAVDQLDAKIKGLPGGVGFFAKSVQENAPLINDTFGGFTASAAALTQQIKDLNTELEKASIALPKIRGERQPLVFPGPQPEGNRFGGPPKYFAFGGPVGTDRVPAWLGEDEYVMTGAATKAFAPLLRQMNSYPSGAGGSGSSIVNVGDVNVTVNGGNTSAATINEIGAGLRRAIARGTVKLHN